MVRVNEVLLCYDNDVYAYGGSWWGAGGGISVYVCVPGVAWCIFRQQQHAGAADSFSAA